MQKIYKVLTGEIRVSNEREVNGVADVLKRCFPDERFFPEPIALDSDENEEKSDLLFSVPSPPRFSSLDLNGLLTPPPDLPSTSSAASTPESKESGRSVAVKSTSKPLPSQTSHQSSIVVYKTKRSMLKPAAAYAKPSENVKSEKPKISVPYKEPVVPKKPAFDPKDKAILIKLNGIKEKIYSKTYLSKDNTQENSSSANMGASSKEIDAGSKPKTRKRRAPTQSPENQKDQVQIPRDLEAKGDRKIELTSTRLRRKAKTVYAEPESDSESTSDEDFSAGDSPNDDDDFYHVPIQKSQSVIIRKSNRISKSPKQEELKIKVIAAKRILRKRQRYHKT